jgi:hypothetical protein
MRYFTLHRSIPYPRNFPWSKNNHDQDNNTPIVISLKQVLGLTPPFQIKVSLLQVTVRMQWRIFHRGIKNKN